MRLNKQSGKVPHKVLESALSVKIKRYINSIYYYIIAWYMVLSTTIDLFFTTISKKRILCLDNWKHQLRFESACTALCKWAACMHQTLSKTFANSLNMQKQFEKNSWEKSTDSYSLSIGVHTTKNHISIYFLLQYQRQRKMFFFSKRELKKALRDPLTWAAW